MLLRYDRPSTALRVVDKTREIMRVASLEMARQLFAIAINSLCGFTTTLISISVLIRMTR
jgi:hypothetical protein